MLFFDLERPSMVRLSDFVSAALLMPWSCGMKIQDHFLILR